MDPDFEKKFFAQKSSRAYLVGINNYLNVKPLDTPHEDCDGLEKVLKEKHDFEVTVQKDATKDQLLQLLQTISAESGQIEKSRIIFYFAGHGVTDGADESKQQPKGYLLLSDSQRGDTGTYMDMGLVLESLAGLQNCHHLLIILDCCYAGAIKYAVDTRSLGFAVPKKLYKEKFSYYVENPAKQVITSAANDQKAVDSLGVRGKNENNRSPFAESLIQALENGDSKWTYGNAQPDGIITASELGFFLSLDVSNQLTRRRVPFAEQQTPSVFPLKSGNKGEFIFIESLQKMEDLPPNPLQNPYKGLSAYSEKDNNLFYGRERVLKGWWEGRMYNYGLLPLIEKEAGTDGAAKEIKPAAKNDNDPETTDENKNEAPRTYYRVLVTGRSGIGKSSLVKAGVMAKLQQGGNSTAIITPGQTPFTTHEKLLQQIESSDQPYYLLVDQYEELVTQCNDETERKNFEGRLSALADAKKAVVIITLRSDIERQMLDGAFLQGGAEEKVYRFLVPNFSRDEIKEIIVQPAAQNLLEFKGRKREGKGEDETNTIFVERLTDETFAYPDSLPMLSEALSRLYESREEAQLKEETYDAFGGINGILNTKVKTVFDSLSDVEKKLFRQFIFRMISFDTGYLAKRRVFTSLSQGEATIDELAFSDEAINKAMAAIRKGLTDARLVSASTTDRPGYKESYIAPSHDALLTSIDQMAQGQNDGAEPKPEAVKGIPFQTRIGTLSALAMAARAYTFSNRKERKGLLWKDDPRLAIVKQMAANGAFVLNTIEEAFVRDSKKAKTRGRYIERIVFISILALAVTAAGIFIVKNKSVNEQKEQVQNKLALNYFENSASGFNDTSQLTSLLLLAKAADINRDTSLNALLRQHLAFYDGSLLLSGVIKSNTAIRLMRLSENDKLLSVLSDSLEVWELPTMQNVFHLPERADDVFCGDEGTKLYLVRDSALECWDIKSGRHLHSTTISTKDSLEVKWAPGHNKILVQTISDFYQLDSNLKIVRQYPNTKLIAVSPDFNFIVTAKEVSGQVDVSLTNLADPAASVVLVHARYFAAVSAAFSLSHNLVAVTNGTEVMVEDLTSGRKVRLAGVDDARDVFFSPDQEYLFIGGGSKPTKVFHISFSGQKLILAKRPEIIWNYFIFSPDNANGYADSVWVQDNTYNYFAVSLRTGKRGTVLQNHDLVNLFHSSAKKVGLVGVNTDGLLKRLAIPGEKYSLPLQLDLADPDLYFDAPNAKIIHNNFLLLKGRSAVYIFKAIERAAPSVPNTIYSALSKNGRYGLTVDSGGKTRLVDIAGNRFPYLDLLLPEGDSLKASADAAMYLHAVVSNDGTTAVVSFLDSGYILNFPKRSILAFKRSYYENHRDSGNVYFGNTLLNPLQATGYSFVGNGPGVIYCCAGGAVYVYHPDRAGSDLVGRIEPGLINLPILFSPDGKYYWTFHSDRDGFASYLKQQSLQPGQGMTTINLEQNTALVVKAVPFNKTAALILSALSEHRELVLLNGAQKKRLQIDSGAMVINFALSSDKRFLLTIVKPGADEAVIHIYATGTWKRVLVFTFLRKAEVDLYALPDVTSLIRQFDVTSDGQQFFIFGLEKAVLVDAVTKKLTVLDLAKGIKHQPLSPTSANFYDGACTVFDGARFKTYAADLDLPQPLFQLQVMATTGSRLNEGTNAVEVIPADELIALWQQYEKEAAAHLKACHYRQQNLYRQLRDLPVN